MVSTACADVTLAFRVAFLLYAATASFLLWLVHRFVRRMSLAACVVLAAIPLTIVGYALITDSVYGPVDYPYQSEPLKALKPLYGIGHAHNVTATDIYAQFLPWRRAVQLSYARGEWPLWNPYNHCGHLMAGSLQSAPFSRENSASYELVPSRSKYCVRKWPRVGSKPMISAPSTRCSPMCASTRCRSAPPGSSS